MYANGDGIPQDFEQAEKWFRLAADRGIAKAQTNLGFLYLRGEGVPQNDVQAHKWFKLASTQGDAEGTKNRDIVEKRMTPQQIAQAEELARNWRPKKQ